MTEIERKRKELDLFITARNFDLTDKDVLSKAVEFEKSIKNTGSN